LGDAGLLPYTYEDVAGQEKNGQSQMPGPAADNYASNQMQLCAAN